MVETEHKKDRGTIKATPEVMDRLYDLAAMIRKTTGRKPTFGAIVSNALAVYEAELARPDILLEISPEESGRKIGETGTTNLEMAGDNVSSLSIPVQHIRLHRDLQDILSSDIAEFHEGIAANLRSWSKLVRALRELQVYRGRAIANAITDQERELIAATVARTEEALRSEERVGNGDKDKGTGRRAG